MSETMPKLTLDLIKEKIGIPEKYDVRFGEGDELEGSFYFYIVVFANVKIYATEYLNSEYYIKCIPVGNFICESLNEAIDRIKQIVGEQNIVV